MPGICLLAVEIATWWITDPTPFWFRYQDVCNHLDLALSSLKQALFIQIWSAGVCMDLVLTLRYWALIFILMFIDAPEVWGW